MMAYMDTAMADDIALPQLHREPLSPIYEQYCRMMINARQGSWTSTTLQFLLELQHHPSYISSAFFVCADAVNAVIDPARQVLLQT